MNWDAIGAIGEIIGAVAVVITLFFLVIQLRQSTRAMEESNRLERVAAMDRHAESVSYWRGAIAGNRELAEIWLKAIKSLPLDDLEGVRLNNMWVNFVNTQRSNYERARAIGEQGLCMQASKSIAVECHLSPAIIALWDRAKPWHELASPEFVRAVEKELEEFKSGNTAFQGGSWLTIQQALQEATGQA